MDAGVIVKNEGKPNDLLDRISKDPLFEAVHDKLEKLMDPILFVGRAPEQVDEFVEDEINPILETFKGLLKIENIDQVNV